MSKNIVLKELYYLNLIINDINNRYSRPDKDENFKESEKQRLANEYKLRKNN